MALSVRINLVRGAKGIHIQLVVQHVGESPAAFTWCNTVRLNFAHSPSTSTSSVLRILLLSTGVHVANASPRQYGLCNDLSGSRASRDVCSSRSRCSSCTSSNRCSASAFRSDNDDPYSDYRRWFTFCAAPCSSWRRLHLPPSVDCGTDKGTQWLFCYPCRHVLAGHMFLRRSWTLAWPTSGVQVSRPRAFPQSFGHPEGIASLTALHSVPLWSLERLLLIRGLATLTPCTVFAVLLGDFFLGFVLGIFWWGFFGFFWWIFWGDFLIFFEKLFFDFFCMIFFFWFFSWILCFLFFFLVFSFF